MLTEHKSERGLWIDLLDPTPEEVERVKTEHGLRVPPRTELDEIETSSRLSREGDVLHMNLPVTTADKDGVLSPSPVGFILSEKVLVTIHYVHLHTTGAVLERLKADKNPSTSADVFAMMMEAMVDFSADQLEKIAADLMHISQRVFRRTELPEMQNIKHMTKLLRRKLSQIGYQGEHLSQIRETLLGLQRIITYTMESCAHWRDKAFLARLETARRDLQSLVEHETHLSDKAQFLLDAILGFINTEQNDIFKVLTIVSVVGIPPTFFASMWGMNFHNMPELAWHYGYWIALGVIALSTILPMAWFKYRGWW